MLAHKGTCILKTSRLTLRRYRKGDANSAMIHFARDERVTRYLSWRPYTNTADFERFIEKCIKSYAEDTTYHWVIDIDGEAVGSISVIDMSEHNEYCGIGYCLGHAYWDKGYMSEALETVMMFLFKEVGMHRIFARHDIKNPASGRVMEKCGMRYEGKLREHFRHHDGSFGDALIYGVLRKEFIEHTAR